MVSGARGRRRVLIACAVAAACAGCAGCGGRGAPIGASSAGFGAGGRLVGADAGATEATPGEGLRSTFAGWPADFAKVTGAVASQGHGAGRWEVEVHASGSARAAYDAAGRYPDGAVFVALHRERRGSLGPTYAMQRQAGGWRFVALDAHGRVLLDAAAGGQETTTGGPESACAACHREAARDGVFVVVP